MNAVIDLAGLVEFKILDEAEEQLPSYGTPGRIMFRLYGMDSTWSWSRFDVDVLGSDGCVMWIEEGEGVDQWLNSHLDLEPVEPVVLVVEGITGIYTRGDWGFTEDSVDWDFERVRYATAEEIAAEGFVT